MRREKPARIAVQLATSAKAVPRPAVLRRYARAALTGRNGDVTIRIVNSAESRTLNRKFRHKDKPTNVLSFSYTPHASRLTPHVQGDIVLCAPVIRREAREQGKAPAAHWAHMVVHGVLHLLGFDHEKSSQARVMEAKERAILAGLSFPDPYAAPAP